MSSGHGNGVPGETGTVIDPAMSLVGKLEDLSLGEILQIVSLSRRSGLLRLESPEGDGNVFIRNGLIIFASSSDESEGILGILYSQGILEMDQIESIKDMLDDIENPAQLRKILEEELDVAPVPFQKSLKKKIEDLLYSFFIWEEGTFSFQLVDDQDENSLFRRMSPFFLDDGISSQFIVMEGARKKDELRRDLARVRGVSSGFIDAGEIGDVDSSDAENLIAEINAFAVPESMPRIPDRIARVVILVTDNKDLMTKLAEALVDTELNLLHFNDAVSSLVRIQELRTHRIFPYLVLDLMSKGIADGVQLGGLDILSTLWELGNNLPASLVVFNGIADKMAELLSDVESVNIVRIDPDDLNRAREDSVGELGGLVELISTEMEARSGDEEEEYYDLERELSDDLETLDLPLDAWVDAEEDVPEDHADPKMAALSSFVAELNRQDISGEITLMALRFASEFASRAVLFLVRRDDLKGLGQFGVDLGEGNDPDKAVRSLALPRDGKSIFSHVIDSHQSYRGAPREDETEKSLLHSLGSETPSVIYVGPIISMGKTAVILYCDDLPDRGGMEDTQSLDIFLSHIGLALDRAFLEMKLKDGK